MVFFGPQSSFSRGARGPGPGPGGPACATNPMFVFASLESTICLDFGPPALLFPEAPGGQGPGQGARPALQTLCSFSRALKAQFHWIFGPQSSFSRGARGPGPGPGGQGQGARADGLRYKPHVRFREPLKHNFIGFSGAQSFPGPLAPLAPWPPAPPALALACQAANR